MSAKYWERQLRPFVVILDNIVKYIPERIVFLLRQGGPAILVTSFKIILSEFLYGLIVNAVSAEWRSVLEPLERFEHSAYGALKLVFVDIIVFLCNYHHRIMTGKSSGRHHPPWIVFIDRCIPGLLFSGCPKNLQRSVCLLHHIISAIGDGGVNVHLQPFGDIMREFHSASDLFETCGIEIALFVFISYRGVKAGLGITPTHTDWGSAPKRDLSWNCRHPIEVRRILGHIQSFKGILLGIVVVYRNTHDICIFCRIGHDDIVRNHRTSSINSSLYPCISFMAWLCGNEYDSGIRSWSINCRCRSILQHFHTFNVIGIDIRIAFCGDSVDNV